MPELPEVETIARTVRPVAEGQIIERVRLLDPLLCAPCAPDEAVRILTGARVRVVRRRGKYLVFELDGSDRETVTFHLRMTGRLLVRPVGEDDEPDRCRMEIRFGSGDRLLFCDMRRLGRLHVDPPAGLRTLGPEPFDEAFGEWLRAALGRRKTAVKAALLDQKVAAGVGNIYADEALHLAGIDPRRPSRELSRGEVSELVRALRRVLSASIEAHGTTISDYVDGHGVPGGFAESLAVYGRWGQPCPDCQTPIERSRLGGRSSHYCPRCQR